MKKSVFALLGAITLLPVAASAKPYHLTPVSWIVATRDNINVDDRYVTIVGHVTRRIGDDEYWFTDETGSVRLDSENFDLPIGRRIAIGGRIDQAYLGFGHLEVDVRRWNYAPLPRRVAAPAPHPAAPMTRTEAPAPTPHQAMTAPSQAPASATPTPAAAVTPATPPSPPPPAAPPTPTTSTTMTPGPAPALITPVGTTNAVSPLTPPPEAK